MLAAADDAGAVRLRDLNTGRQRVVRDGGGSGVTVIAFSPDNRFLACGHETGTVELWDVAAFKGPGNR
jgi:WD40 repeat protein